MKGRASEAALIGDVVGSRLADDRVALHRRLVRTLAEVTELVPAREAPKVLNGDEFQARYDRVGLALAAALRIRIALLPEIDVRIGIGWGHVMVIDAKSRIEDGSAWWVARDAIEAVAAEQTKASLGHSRAAYRRAPDAQDGPDEDAVNAALLCQSQLIGDLDARGLRILAGLLTDQTQTQIARAEGISDSAVSQRTRQDGSAVILASSRLLERL